MAFTRHRIEKITTIGAAAMEAKTLNFWLYMAGADTLAQVLAADYFNFMADRDMGVGDIIDVHAADGRGAFKVTAVSAAGAVTVKRTGSVSGQAATVAAVDTIVTGLSKVRAVIATLNDAPVAGCQFVTADVGDQAGAPAAGSFLLKTWKSTAGGDTTQVAATTFGKKVNWVAFGE